MFYVAIEEAIEKDGPCKKAAKFIVQTRGYGSSAFSVPNLIRLALEDSTIQMFKSYLLCYETAVKERVSPEVFEQTLQSANQFLVHFAAIDLLYFQYLEKLLNGLEAADFSLSDDEVSGIYGEISPLGKVLMERMAPYPSGLIKIEMDPEPCFVFTSEFFSETAKLPEHRHAYFQRKCPALSHGVVPRFWDEFAKVCRAYGLEP